MTPRHRILAGLTLAVAVACFGTVSSAGKPNAAMSATAEFSDCNAIGAPAGTGGTCQTVDGVTSDGKQDTYTTASNATATFDYVDGMDNAQLDMAGGGTNFAYNLQYQTSLSQARDFCFNFGANNDLSQSSTPVPPQGASPCRVIHGGLTTVSSTFIGMLSMTPGQQDVRTMGMSWTETDSSGTPWVYHFNYGGDWNGDGKADSNPVIVACLAAGTSTSCGAWRVQPDPRTTLADGAAAVPYQMTFSRNQVLPHNQLGPTLLIGQYSMPFTLNVGLK